jgi:hypothetical protein
MQSLTVNGTLRALSGASRASVTVTNGLLISGTAARLVVSNADLTCAALLLTNGAALTLYSGLPMGGTNYGQLVRVTGEMAVASNCWVYPYSHPTNGTSPFFWVGSLRIDGPTGGVNANASGFTVGYGPGCGLIGRTGGGYGGRGQNYSVANGGGTYGSASAPAQPGSPGKSENTSGTGGGLVRILSESSVTVNGMITANGQDCGGYSAAGSGGGIHVVCDTFSGNANGLLSAVGGTANATVGWGAVAGGGGRIAVWRIWGTFSGTASATNGAGGDSGVVPLATTGTVYWGQLPPRTPGVLLILR